MREKGDGQESLTCFRYSVQCTVHSGSYLFDFVLLYSVQCTVHSGSYLFDFVLLKKHFDAIIKP
jgi:hypothetical protein